MRKLSRLDLSVEAHDDLARRTSDIQATPASERVAEAGRLWGSFRGRTREEVRRVLREMASGLNRCMYCEDSEGTAIDHFRPKSLDPLRTFEWNNHLLACSYCNSNFKRTQFPTEAGQPLLIDPTADDPADHLSFTPHTGDYFAKDRKGEASIDVFGLNRETCARGRANALIGLQALIRSYQRAIDAGEMDQRDRILQAITEHPFQAVREFLRVLLAGPGRDLLMPSDVVQIVADHPELVGA